MPGPMSLLGVCLPGLRSLPGGGYVQEGGYTGGTYTRESGILGGQVYQRGYIRGEYTRGAGYAAGVCIPTPPQALTTTTHTVGKLAVRILLECFLVVNRFSYDYDLRLNFESSVN